MKIRERLRRWSDKLDHVAQEVGLRSPDSAKRRGVYSDPDQMHEKLSMLPGETLTPHNTVIDASGRMQDQRRPIISVHGKDVTEDELRKPAGVQPLT